MTDLNPYFVAVSGALYEERSRYPNTQLFDYRRDRVTAVSQYLLPSAPLAANPALLGPFAGSTNSPRLAAPSEQSGR